MVNDTTKKIILIMTIIVIIVMAYLVHSPKFLDIAKDGKITLKANIDSKLNNKNLFQKRSKIKLDKKEKISKTLPDLTKQKVKIGISIPLSGDGGIIGNAIKQSLEMAKKEIPSNTKFQYEVVIEDSSKSKSTFVSAYKLVDNHKVDALLSLGNKESQVVADIADNYKIPHITCVYGRNIVNNHKYTINHFPTPETKAEAFIKNLDDNNIRIFSIVYSDTPYFTEIINAVEKEAKNYNFSIKSKAVIKKGQSNFNAEIKIITENKPEAVMVMLSPEEMDVFASELNKTGEKYIYTSIDTLYHFYNRELVEDAVFVVASVGDYKFKEDFRKKSVLQIPLCAPQLYDAVKMFILAYENSNKDIKPQGSDIIINLKKIVDFPSATGSDISVSKEGTIDSPMIGMKVDRGLLKYQ